MIHHIFNRSSVVGILFENSTFCKVEVCQPVRITPPLLARAISIFPASLLDSADGIVHSLFKSFLKKKAGDFL